MGLPLALLLAPAVIQGVTGASQLVKARKMQKELGDRVNYEIPEEAERAYALAQGLASSREMPGQASMQAMMDYQAQKALGTFSRGASSSTEMAALSADIAERQFESQLGLGVQAAKDYQQRQQALYGAMQNMAGYQDKVTADRQQDWYERAQAAAQMKEGGLQNLMGAAKGIGQLGMMKMMYGGGGDDVRPSLSEGVEKIGSIGAGQLPTGGSAPTGLMTGSTITGRNVFFGNNNIPGASGQLPVNQSGLMPTGSMMGRTFFQQNPLINSIQGQLPVNQLGLMPSTSFKDVMKLYNTFY
jgi:hypothetical protein